MTMFDERVDVTTFWQYFEWEVVWSLQLTTIEGVPKDESEFARRGYVRTVFSGVESAIALAKALLPRMRGVVFTREEQLFVDELREARKDNAAVERKPDRRHLTDNLKETLRLCAKKQNLPAPDVARIGWKSLKESYEIRNCIIHPRTLADLNVSDADLKTLDIAWQWLRKEVERAVLSIDIGDSR